MCDLQEKLLKNHEIVIRSYKGNHVENIPELLNKINDIINIKEDSIIQLMNTDNICGIKHLNHAIAHTFKAFDEKTNFANDNGLEICVRLSAQKQISIALKMLGIKTDGNITVVYIDACDTQIEKVEKLLSNRCDELLEEYDEDSIVKLYKLDCADNILDSINEKIALLSIKS